MTDTATPGALDLVKLRELAKAVGPWTNDPWGIWTYSEDDPDHLLRRLYDADEAEGPEVAYVEAVLPQNVMALCDEVERLRAGIAPLYHPRDDDSTYLRRCLICGRTSRIVEVGELAIIQHEPDCVLATPTAEPAVPVETEARDE